MASAINIARHDNSDTKRQEAHKEYCRDYHKGLYSSLPFEVDSYEYTSQCDKGAWSKNPYNWRKVRAEAHGELSTIVPLVLIIFDFLFCFLSFPEQNEAGANRFLKAKLRHRTIR
jgi:hypothetical protein